MYITVSSLLISYLPVKQEMALQSLASSPAISIMQWQFSLFLMGLWQGK